MNVNSTFILSEAEEPVPNNSQPPELFQLFSQAPSTDVKIEGEAAPPGAAGIEHAPLPFIRRIGAQPGNQNARKHGLYSKYLAPKQRQDYNAACGVRGVEAELALFRCKLAEMLETEPWNWTLLNRITNTILRLEAALPPEPPENKVVAKVHKIICNSFVQALAAGDERITKAFDEWMEKNHPVGFVPENESHVQPEADSA